MPGGTKGIRTDALTNAFEIKWPSGRIVHHYDVMTPLWESTRASDTTIGSKKGTELMMRLQETVAPHMFNPLGAYDGKKNLFSPERYKLTSEEFRVSMDSNPRRHPKEVAIRITFVKTVDFSILKGLLQGSAKVEPDSEMTLNMLNVFVQASPRIETISQMRPLELWRGYFQSVRPTFDRLLVNVDCTIGVVVPQTSLDKFCIEFLNKRDYRELNSLRPHELRKLKQVLKGINVLVKLPGHSNKKGRPIKDIVERVGETTFEKDGETITVAKHFKAVHNYPIPPGSPGVKIGRDGLFPMGVCQTTVQLFKGRSTPEIVQAALKFSPARPQERLNVIRGAWEQLRYERSPFLVPAGVKVTPSPIGVRGRTLQPPHILFGGGNMVNFSSNRDRAGVWDVMRKTLLKPASLRSWVVLNISGSTDMQLIIQFVRELQAAMRERAADVQEPHDIITRDPNADIEGILGQGALNLVLAILPQSAAEPYRKVKRYGDITQGVVTQCVKWSPKLAQDTRSGKANQYHNNLILKYASLAPNKRKLGGVNFSVGTPHTPTILQRLADRPTMILGADVSHPGPGSMLPSICALVSSWDSKFCEYSASVRVQEKRIEMIADLTEMMMDALHVFNKKNGCLPRRLLLFRDGVSEGEFSQVLEKEVGLMSAAMRAHYGPDNSKWPPITVIIVGKRHHFRFFPVNAQAADPRGNGNLTAGFVTDRDIVHPAWGNFYLQSQPGLKGTSRPSHYTVLLNGNKFVPDEFALCHCYSRATRSVKIPAPLVCRRAKIHFDDEVNFSDDMSSAADGEEASHIDYFKKHFSDINERLKQTMYFV
ncbi:Piwi domain-containing protein [Infundibulicybe gibba]|nr:Piwi domain-containing protein [Infundibulicybe gibba]